MTFGFIDPSRHKVDMAGNRASIQPDVVALECWKGHTVAAAPKWPLAEDEGTKPRGFASHFHHEVFDAITDRYQSNAYYQHSALAAGCPMAA